MHYKEITKEWLYNQYIILKKGCTEISKEFDLSRATLNKKLKDFKIPSRQCGTVSDRTNKDGLILCTKCNLYMGSDKFYIRPNTKKYSSWCKRCQLKTTSDNRNKNRQRYNKTNNNWKTKVISQRRIKVNEYKTKCGCSVCGYNKFSEGLDFHHMNPKDKNYNITTQFCYTDYINRINTETKKCILLCALCHRLVENNCIDVSHIPLISEDVISS